MRAVVQRVTRAQVSVQGEKIGSIAAGLLVLVGFGRADGPGSVPPLLDRLLGLRIFEDEAGKMNRSLTEVGGGLLLVSQFTLYADLSRGRRPSFGPALDPRAAEPLFEALVLEARRRHAPVASGRFGADMQVELVNDGPVTLWLGSD